MASSWWERQLFDPVLIGANCTISDTATRSRDNYGRAPLPEWSHDQLRDANTLDGDRTGSERVQGRDRRDGDHAENERFDDGEHALAVLSPREKIEGSLPARYLPECR